MFAKANNLEDNIRTAFTSLMSTAAGPGGRDPRGRPQAVHPAALSPDAHPAVPAQRPGLPTLAATGGSG